MVKIRPIKTALHTNYLYLLCFIFPSSQSWTALVCDGLVGWWPGTELNRRHKDFQSSALPTELPGRLLRDLRKDCVVFGISPAEHGERKAAI